MKGKGIYIPRPPKLVSPVWTKTPPTVPGLYWFSLRTDERPGAAVLGVLRHCRVVRHQSGKMILGVKNYDADDFGKVEGLQRWWAGPLLEPVE